MLAATFALVVALIVDRWGFLTKAIGDRIAAILALFALTVFVGGSPAARWLVKQGNKLAGWLGDFSGQFLGPKTAEAISQYGIAMLVLAVAFMWIMAMLPVAAQKVAGDAALMEMNSLIIWGGATTIVIGAALIPGDLGDLVRSVTGLGVTAGGQLAGVIA